MVDHFSLAFGVPNQSITAEYDARTDAALARVVSTLPPNAAQLQLGQLDEALTEREFSWRNVLGASLLRWRRGRRAFPGPETLAVAQSCDCTAEMEVPGLLPGIDLRPADVLTSALGNSYTALDIFICSPHAQQALSDWTQTRHEAKLAYYGPHIPSLLRQNISCTPVVWSACGRPHRDTLTVLRSVSKSIARKRTFVSAEVVYQKLHASITLEIWTRSARQIPACSPLAALPDSLEPES